MKFKGNENENKIHTFCVFHVAASSTFCKCMFHLAILQLHHHHQHMNEKRYIILSNTLCRYDYVCSSYHDYIVQIKNYADLQ